MKKKLLYVLIFIILLILALFGYQKYQNYKLNNYKPTIETPDSLAKFLDSIKVIEKSTVIIPKNAESFSKIQPYFSIGAIYVLNKNLDIIDNNFSDENGRCYADINKYICGDFVKTNNKFQEKYKDRIQILQKNTMYLFSNKEINFDGNYDYVIIYSWGKFMPPSYKPEQVSFLKCLKNKNILLLSLNMDQQSSWK